MSDTQKVTVRGTLSFAKILGEPVPNYNKDGKEWKLDLVLDTPEAVRDVEDVGLKDRIKNKADYVDGKPYISLKHRETFKDGTKQDPIPVVNDKGLPWNPETLIGNGTKADVKFTVVDYGKGKYPGVYVKGVRILELVPYVAQPFAPLAKDDPYNRQDAELAELAADDDDEGDADEAHEIDDDNDDLEDEIPM